jgi:quinol monooxygenase YgiN
MISSTVKRTVAALALLAAGAVQAESARAPLVRIAELEIHPGQLDRYKAAVREEIETSVRIEPGVLAIYSVAEKDNPARLRFFEIYADEAAYQSHIASAHFRKYVEITRDMIISRKLIETEPVQLSAKPMTTKRP